MKTVQHVAVRDALNRAEAVKYEGDRLTPTDVEWDTIDNVTEAVRVWRFAQLQEQAAKQVARVAAEQLASLLGEGGATAYGDTIVRFRKKRTERCIDPTGVIGYLTQQVKSDTVDLSTVMNPQYMKRTWMTEAVRDTFYEWEDGAAVVTLVPRDKAPKWLQDLKDGDVV